MCVPLHVCECTFGGGGVDAWVKGWKFDSAGYAELCCVCAILYYYYFIFHRI